MDNTALTLTDRLSANGSTRRTSPIPTMSPTGRPASLMDTHNQSVYVVQVVVNRDERGYGMMVSGDNPVYVQSVKEGGAAEKAGLHAGDKIIKVNDVNVISSTHTEVVDLIRSSSQVVLTVQQRSGNQKVMGSPSVHNRPLTTPSRITGPQPVDHEKQYQLQLEKEQHYRLMIEKEQRYIDVLRSQIASSPDEKKYSELSKTEKNLQTLQAMLLRSQNEQSPPLNTSTNSLSTSLPRKIRASTVVSPNGNSELQSPPPLPKRNQRPSHVDTLNNRHLPYVNGKIVADTNALFLNNEINANMRQVESEDVTGRRPPRMSKFHSNSEEAHLVDNPLYSDQPPPLPPRVPLSAPIIGNEPNSINKQMAYPLVATCATLVNDYSPNPTHHRTKSSPESLLALSAADASKKLTASESMNDLRQEGWDPADTPPGTPPPPYPSPPSSRRRPYGTNESGDHIFDESKKRTFVESLSIPRPNLATIAQLAVSNRCRHKRASRSSTPRFVIPAIIIKDNRRESRIGSDFTHRRTSIAKTHKKAKFVNKLRRYLIFLPPPTHPNQNSPRHYSSPDPESGRKQTCPESASLEDNPGEHSTEAANEGNPLTISPIPQFGAVRNLTLTSLLRQTHHPPPAAVTNGETKEKTIENRLTSRGEEDERRTFR
ncbi:hypothetical protein Zmor_005721 [Zophobas morio]|uniref:PDZ domain-containing protein n=1 Tax=Zophobas morio TaxID=2755281 RepID=A0AA38IQA0_9CUCU|nr:hypothetical protein Zmor_005721 [Zophobas morio]